MPLKDGRQWPLTCQGHSNTMTYKKVIMVLKNELCELMVKVNPTNDNQRKPALYVLYNSLNGLMRSTLLFYRKLKRELIDYGFVISRYNPCVTNKWMKAGKLTVLWHMYDLCLRVRSSVWVCVVLCTLS